MNFNSFIKFVPKIAKETLLGEKAHTLMVPANRLNSIKNNNTFEKSPRIAAVLMLIYPKNKEAHLALIKRNSYPGTHGSQIAFPGGKEEKSDISLSFTALRETEEEIGINSELIEIIKFFTHVYIPPSNFLVSPFLGISKTELVFLPNPAEVAEIIELPLAKLLNDNILTSVKMSTSYAKDIEVPAFQINEHIVWGATAMMLSELKEIIKKVL